MADTPEQQEVAAGQSTSTTEAKTEPQLAPTSPTLSDKSSDSEGKPVREKLQETRIDVQGTSGLAPGADQPMNDLPNGSGSTLDQSTSGSDSERGRLRRKRSHEDFEEGHEVEKEHEKPISPTHNRHARKKSRDSTKDTEVGTPIKPTARSISRIEEVDTEMTSPNKNASRSAYEKISSAATSPKNKRTRDQIEKDTEGAAELSKGASLNGKPVENGGDERDSKRLRDKDETTSDGEASISSTKATFGNGFANISASSPFAAISAKSSSSIASDKAGSLLQTSDDKFKSSGFGSFATSTTSPFGGLAGAQASSASPFGTASGSKVTSFTGSASPPTTTGSGFSALSAPTKLGFGGSSFGGSLGGGFASLGGAKPGLTSFGTPGNLEITGLKSKSAKPFGAAAENESSDEEDGEDSDTEKDKPDQERRSSQPLLSQQPQETGEEGETTVWTGRTKLYSMTGEPDARAWKERGTGTFKFNVTIDEPKKARFVLRADGTHRLVLNAAVTKSMVFGGDGQGEKPKDGRLVFNEPVGDGAVEMHLLKLKTENAIKLWEEVHHVQESEL